MGKVRTQSAALVAVLVLIGLSLTACSDSGGGATKGTEGPSGIQAGSGVQESASGGLGPADDSPDSASGGTKSTASKPASTKPSSTKATSRSTPSKGSSGGGSTASSGSAATASGASRQPSGAAARRYARQVLGEQMQSQANIAKLAAGKIGSFDLDPGSTSGSRWSGRVVARFKDGTSAPGTMVFSRYEGAWYFSSITGMRSGNTGGEADTVNPTGIAGGYPPIDESLVPIMLEQTKRNQAAYRDLVAGKITGFSIDSVNRGLGTTSLSTTARFSSGKSRKARVGMLRKGKNWYLVRFTYI